MKKFFLCLFIFYSLFSSAQNPLVKMWDKRYGGTAGEGLYSLFQTSDRGYILGGSSQSGISGDHSQDNRGLTDYWIVKIDSLGNIQWDKDFGGTDEDGFGCIQQTIDGGYIIGGRSESGISGDHSQDNRGSTDYWIVKIDSLGNKLWDKDFGGTNEDFFYSLQQTNDGGYIIGGTSRSDIGGDKTEALRGGSGDYDYWIIKTDSLGNKQWDKDFGGENGDWLFSLIVTLDGGYLLGGHSPSDVSGDKTEAAKGSADYWIVKIDSSGNKKWDKDFGGIDFDGIHSLLQTQDSGYLLCGGSNSGIGYDKTEDTQDTSSNSYYQGDFWIVKTDSLGNKLWDRDFGGLALEWWCSAKPTDDGYLLAGTSRSNAGGDKSENNLGPEQSWVVKIDSLGNKKWDRTLLINGFSSVGYAIQSNDGCYIMANSNDGTIGGDRTEDNWNNSHDFWIIKFCDSALIDIHELSNENSFLISPNPTSGKFEIRNPELKIDHIEIYNVLGKKIMELAVNREPITVNCEQLSPGIYFVKAIAGEKVLVGKVVKQ